MHATEYHRNDLGPTVLNSCIMHNVQNADNVTTLRIDYRSELRIDLTTKSSVNNERAQSNNPNQTKSLTGI